MIPDVSSSLIYCMNILQSENKFCCVPHKREVIIDIILEVFIEITVEIIIDVFI
ncbi:MAG: hypothetical protein ACRCUY_06420 [Thermoguttaceae bacterium]